MIKPMNTRKAVVIGALLPLLYFADGSPDAPAGLTLMRDAHAVVGAPMTPISVAGVARRTTRRAVVAIDAPRPHAPAAQPAAAQHRGRRPAAGRCAAARRRTGRRRSGQCAARRLRAGGQGRRRVPEVRRGLVPLGFPRQQPGLRRSVDVFDVALMSENVMKYECRGWVRTLGIGVLVMGLAGPAAAADPGRGVGAPGPGAAWCGSPRRGALAPVSGTLASTSRAPPATWAGRQARGRRGRRGGARCRRGGPGPEPAGRGGQRGRRRPAVRSPLTDSY